MLTNAEWVAAATGTPDPDTDNGTTDCNTGSPGTPTNQPGNTGSRSSCVSTAGIFDGVGNVWEWTRESFSPFGGPQAWFHGGAWSYGTLAGVGVAYQDDPLLQFYVIGFRCAR